MADISTTVVDVPAVAEDASAALQPEATTMEGIIETLQENLTEWALSLIGAIAILIIGRWVAGLVKGIVHKALTKRELDPTVTSFLSNLAFVLLMVFVIIAALGCVGVQAGSFIAIVGAAGLAIGLALQGSLANFAAGFLLLIFRPFTKGDFIEGAGTAGVVDEIQMFTTILHTPDNKKVIIPNAKLTGDNITNYSATGTRRVEIIAGVSYSDDLDKVRGILEQIAGSDDRVLEDPASMVAVKEMADSSINFVFRVWVKTENYWGVYFDMTERIKKRFDAEGVSIPFPQRDVHLYEHKN